MCTERVSNEGAEDVEMELKYIKILATCYKSFSCVDASQSPKPSSFPIPNLRLFLTLLCSSETYEGPKGSQWTLRGGESKVHRFIVSSFKILSCFLQKLAKLICGVDTSQSARTLEGPFVYPGRVAHVMHLAFED